MSVAVPDNAQLGPRAVVSGDFSFKRFHATAPDALVSGADCTFDGVQFAVGREGRVRIGEGCCMTNAVLLCEQEISIGSWVLVGWNVTIADTDFHPIAPAQRLADARALSPGGDGRLRPFIATAPVVIEDDVVLGPASTVLKGVRIGAGAWVEAGAVVTADVPPGARVLGNPAREVVLR